MPGIKIILLIGFLSLAACDIPDRNTLHHAYGSLEFNPAKTDAKMPEAPVPLPDGLETLIHEAEQINQVFKVERFLKLECKDASVIAQIDSVVYLDECWFILDSLQKKVLKFDDKGRFVQQISRVGEGPGEFRYPTHMKRVGDLIAVGDPNHSAVLLFDGHGNHIRSLSTFPHKIFLQHAFILTDQYRLYTAYPRSGRADAPFHAVFDFAKDPGTVLYGFGERFALLEKKIITGATRKRLTAFEKIGDRIWTGSPYGSHLDIFDLEGRFLGKLPSGLDGLQYSDFEKINFRNRKERYKLYGKLSNGAIHQVGPLVVVSLEHQGGSLFNLYDQAGNLLKKGLERSDCYRKIHLGFKDQIIGSFPVDIEYVAYYQKYLTKEEFRNLENAGWDPNNFSDDNPYLVIGKSTF